MEDEACLNAVVDRFDYTVDRLPRVIKAWKQGNMPVLLNTFDDEDEAHCLPQSETAKDVVSPNNAPTDINILRHFSPKVTPRPQPVL